MHSIFKTACAISYLQYINASAGTSLLQYLPAFWANLVDFNICIYVCLFTATSTSWPDIYIYVKHRCPRERERERERQQICSCTVFPHTFLQSVTDEVSVVSLVVLSSIARRCS